MKIKLGNSIQYIDVDISHPHLLSSEEGTKKIKKEIEGREIFCSGCNKEIKSNGYISTMHKPKSAVDSHIEDSWTLHFFCFDTKEECANKWIKKRKQ
jgi:hypothetical protein|tara:strand:+ start:15 stop:305 length:291 start_codon:yes stop_codon:yes gene_type:complete